MLRSSAVGFINIMRALAEQAVPFMVKRLGCESDFSTVTYTHYNMFLVLCLSIYIYL